VSSLAQSAAQRGRVIISMALSGTLLLSACAAPKPTPSEASSATMTMPSAAPETPAPVAASQPPKPENLRLVLRSGMEITAAKQGSESLVVQPLVGDLWQALAIKPDSSDTVGASRLATARDLEQLRLTPGDAFALGQQNAKAGLPPLASVTHDLTPHQIGIIQSKDDQTSRVLATKDWAALAQQLDGHLLIAVPASDTVIYCEENGTQSVRTFAATARDMAAQSGHAVSPALLRWTPAGWQSVLVP